MVRELYEALAARDLRWSRALYHPDAELQYIRTPDTILHGSGDATCLDLALLFAGAALGKELLPLVVVLDGHALVAMSLTTERRARRQRCSSQSGRRLDRERAAHRGGRSAGARRERQLRAAGMHRIRSRCRRDRPVNARGSGPRQRPDDVRASRRGRPRAARASRPPIPVRDRVAFLQDIAKIAPLTPPASGLERVDADLRLRLRKLREDYSMLAGRVTELAMLDTFADSDGSG